MSSEQHAEHMLVMLTRDLREILYTIWATIYADTMWVRHLTFLSSPVKVDNLRVLEVGGKHHVRWTQVSVNDTTFVQVHYGTGNLADLEERMR